jgi:hypothetical protein
MPLNDILGISRLSHTSDPNNFRYSWQQSIALQQRLREFRPHRGFDGFGIIGKIIRRPKAHGKGDAPPQSILSMHPKTNRPRD